MTIEPVESGAFRMESSMDSAASELALAEHIGYRFEGYAQSKLDEELIAHLRDRPLAVRLRGA